MKFALTIVFFLFFTWQLLAQTYVVLHLKGTILRKDTQQPLNVGDRLSEDISLVFTNTDALAVVISHEKGKMILNAQQAKRENNNEFIATAREILLPLKSSIASTTKEEAITNFKDYFGEGNFAIIGNSLKVKVSNEKFPLDNQHFIVLKYEYEGKKINKPIPQENQWIMLEKKGMFDNYMKLTTIDKVDLYYYVQSTKEYTKLASFSPLFLDETTLKKEVGVLIEFLKENALPREKIKLEANSFIKDVYGRVDENQLNDWLENTLNEILR